VRERKATNYVWILDFTGIVSLRHNEFRAHRWRASLGVFVLANANLPRCATPTNALPPLPMSHSLPYLSLQIFSRQTMGSCNPRLARATNKIMSHHYPERPSSFPRPGSSMPRGLP
jgi:hypothetical protein